jgi:hypothetical protein
MTLSLDTIEVTDVPLLTDEECREVIGQLSLKQEILSPRETAIFDAADDRLYDNDLRDYEADVENCEGFASFDLSDDGDALASAGWGTDEDYGGDVEQW